MQHLHLSGLNVSQIAGVMLRFLSAIDIQGFIVLVLVLLFVGNKISANYGRLRTLSLSLSGLFLVTIVGLYLQSGGDSGEIAVRGALAASFLLAVLWIVLPPIAATCGAVFRVCLSVRSWIGRRIAPIGALIRARRERYRERAYDDEAVARRKQDDEYAKELARIHDDANQRRQEARGRCEVLFATHSYELRGRFTPEMFDAFMAKHLGDDKPPEYVEKLSIELCGVIEKHFDRTDGRVKKSLAELARWFLLQKQQIEETNLSEEDKQLLMAQLEERYVKLQEKYLRSVQP